MEHCAIAVPAPNRFAVLQEGLRYHLYPSYSTYAEAKDQCDQMDMSNLDDKFTVVEIVFDPSDPLFNNGLPHGMHVLDFSTSGQAD